MILLLLIADTVIVVAVGVDGVAAAVVLLVIALGRNEWMCPLEISALVFLSVPMPWLSASQSSNHIRSVCLSACLPWLSFDRIATYAGVVGELMNVVTAAAGGDGVVAIMLYNVDGSGWYRSLVLFSPHYITFQFYFDENLIQPNRSANSMQQHQHTGNFLSHIERKIF